MYNLNGDMVFNVIKVDYRIEKIELEVMLIKNVAYEFIDNLTLLYCFNMSRLKVNKLLLK